MPVLPQIRLPFTKKNQNTVYQNAGEHGAVQEAAPTAPRGHKREKSTSSISILSRASQDEDTNTYKLSVVNDSGVYLPPSPTTEKRGFWGRTDSTNSSIQGKDIPDTQDGGFAISRESFDGYRRSFDISARTPVNESERRSMQSSRSSFDNSYQFGRASLDSRMYSSNILPSIDVSESSEDEEFRDVELNESQLPPKKKGFLTRLVGGNSEDDAPKGRARSSTLTWRKEQNKDAEELGAVGSDNGK